MIHTSKIKVAVGLSGGVDSSLSAALLVEEGYEVSGVFLECWKGPGCRVDEDRKDALDIALKLGIPFQVLDFKQAYYEKVVDYFYQEYEVGRTPNPDTMCNREIKFGMFYDWAIRQNGFNYVATGHYTRIEARKSKCEARNKSECMKSKNSKLDVVSNFARLPTRQNSSASNFLVRGVDEKKDQSYFLYQLQPEQLEHILFPIGNMTKAQVRTEASKRGLTTANKPDSQGICFIGPVNVKEFLKERIEEKEGDVVIEIRSTEHEARNKSERLKTKNSKLEIVSDFDIRDSDLFTKYLVVGKHMGVAFHTVGQKIGKELDQGLIARLSKKGVLDFDPANMPHLFVIGKDVDQNILIVGTEDELLCDEFEVEEVNWLVKELRFKSLESRVFTRIRHGGEIMEALLKIENSKLKIKTIHPVKGLASGQACVFYSNDSSDAILLGGGVIV